MKNTFYRDTVRGARIMLTRAVHHDAKMVTHTSIALTTHAPNPDSIVVNTRTPTVIMQRLGLGVVQHAEHGGKDIVQ